MTMMDLHNNVSHAIAATPKTIANSGSPVGSAKVEMKLEHDGTGSAGTYPVRVDDAVAESVGVAIG